MKPESQMDARLERLLDEELRAVLDAPAVDLRDKVLQALDEGRGTRGEGRGTRDVLGGDVESGFSRIQPRWTFALAAAAVLLFAVVTLWRGSVPKPVQSTANRPPLASAPLLTATVIQPAAERPPGDRRLAAGAIHSRNAAPFAWDLKPVAADASPSTEPYLPGAPAGELGDPLRPLPWPPTIAFAPITPAPPVSELARPVTDFPADNTAPAQPSSGEAGQSGGSRR